MLPCIVTDLFFNNQPDARIFHTYSVTKIYVSGILSAHHQEFSTVHSTLVSFIQVFLMTASKQSQDGTHGTPFHPDSAWKRSSKKTCTKLTSAECTVENS